MPMTTCQSCRSILRFRLRSLILELQHRRRRGFHTSPQAAKSSSSAGTHITSQYTDTFPPSVEQLNAARHFFLTHVPTKSWTASEWRKHSSQHSDDLTDITPEIAFLGRSNSGKSSLMNALLDMPGLCRVGPRPGKTTTMHAWTLAPRPPEHRGIKAKSKSSNNTTTTTVSAVDWTPKITVLDMPGYGYGSRTEWGEEIIKYLRRRRQLRRAFVLLNPGHGVKASDEQILKVLRTEGIAHQIVACKCDDIRPASALSEKLEELRVTTTESAARQHALGLVLNDVLAVGNLGDGRSNNNINDRSDGKEKKMMNNMRGVEDVRWAVLQATGLEQYAINLYVESMQTSLKEKRPLRVTDAVPPATVSTTGGGGGYIKDISQI